MVRLFFRVMSVAALLASCSEAPKQPPRPAHAATPIGAIPADLQGRYALTPATCDLPASATPAQVRGLLTIGPAAIAFGVDQQSVDSIAPHPDRIVIDTNQTVEGGAVESRRYAFRIAPDRRTLTRVELNRPDQVYTRCPNRPS